ncbi:MAG: hypothetical protein ACTHJ0_07150 [Flavipsychrobacter sp.]
MYEAINITGTKEAILKTLQYYALFYYPLTIAEIHGSCACECSLNAVEKHLDELLDENIIYKCNDLYSTLSNIEQLAARRKQGNAIALKKYLKAVKAARIIYSFPFVRFVGISGSISKGYAEAKSDLDFFIITERNRLWICRTLLHLFKKLTFIVGAQHRFCMNYFIDTAALALEERNIFTATELTSMIPLHGSICYKQFNAANNWTNSYFPNGYMPFILTGGIDDSKSISKGIWEKFINLLNPRTINKRLMQITDKRWQSKWSRKNYPMTDYNIAFKTTLHISKNHPANHQKRVLSKLAAI